MTLLYQLRFPEKRSTDYIIIFVIITILQLLLLSLLLINRYFYFLVDLNLDMVEVRKVSRYTLSTFSTKYLWIRLALVEKVLPNILMSLADNWR